MRREENVLEVTTRTPFPLLGPVVLEARERRQHGVRGFGDTKDLGV